MRVWGGWFHCLPQRGTPAVVWEEEKEEEAPGRANEKLIVHMHCNVNYCLLVACVAETKKKRNLWWFGFVVGLAAMGGRATTFLLRFLLACFACSAQAVELVEFDAGVQ